MLFLYHWQLPPSKLPKYAEIEHQQSSKKDKKVRDKTAVLYSEIKLEEPPEVCNYF